MRQLLNLREEPSAGKPHAGFCEGESRMTELLDHAPKGWVLADSSHPP